MRGKLKLHRSRIRAFRDPVYDSFLFSKFINLIIKRGHKARVLNTFYEIMAHKLSKQYSSYFIFFEILEKFKPRVGIVSVKKRGVNHFIPVPITPEKKYRLARKYFYNYIRRNKDGVTFSLNLVNQFRQLFFARRLVIKELEDNKKHALLGRVFSHYR